MIQVLVGPWVSAGASTTSDHRPSLTSVLTNTAPVGAYRGAGRPEAIYIIERLMDAARAARSSTRPSCAGAT